MEVFIAIFRKMATVRMVLFVFTSTIVLLRCCSLAGGQVNPALDISRMPIERNNQKLAMFKQILDDRGLDYDNTIAFINNDQLFIEYLTSKLPEIDDLVQRTPLHRKNALSDDLIYAFEGENEVGYEISETCVDDVIQYYKDVINGVYYARRMRSAGGRIPRDAQYTGNLKDLGNIWLCTSTLRNETSNVPQFNGKYCASTIPDAGVILGGCWPDSCSEMDVNSISSLFWKEIVNVEPFLYFDCQERRPWSTADIGFTCALAFFALMVGMGSFYDIFLQKLVLDKMKGNDNKNMIQITKYETAQVTRSHQVDHNVFVSPSSADVDETVVGRPAEEMEEKDDKEDELQTGARINGGYIADDEKTASIERQDAEDGHTREKSDKSNFKWALLHAIMMSFSFVHNCKKLLSAKKTKNNMSVLNGLRVLSIFWVMLCHSLLYTTTYRLGNPLQTIDVILNHMSFNAITSGSYSVDTFFVLSGFLVSYMTLKHIDMKMLKTPGSWVMFYFNRWWRLTPVYMATMGIWALWWPHFGDGRSIVADETYDFYKGWCRKQWWTHPLYINNLYPWPNVYNNSCMRWSWYLAVDMQFFIISPIILIILYRNSKAGMALITSILLISLASLFGISWYYGYPINSQPAYNDHIPDPPDADVVYAKPYTRIPPYLAGLVLGFIIFNLKGKKVEMKMSVAVSGWLLTLASLFAVVYGTWSGSDRYVPQIEAVIYLTFSRLGWGVAICWIIFACLQGYGGPVGVFLEWSFWIPLARLSYCIYLVHPIVMYTVIFTEQTLFHFTYVSIAYLYVGNVVFSCAAALILSLLVEGPMMGIEKVMFGKFKRS